MDSPTLRTEVTMPLEGPPARRAARPLTSLGRATALAGLAVWEALVVLWLALTVTLLVVGVGVLLVPSALDLVRADARRQRALALGFSGVRVTEDYLPLPPEAERHGLGPAWRRTHAMLGDRATWRDLLWHVVNPVVGLAIALLPLVAVLHGVWGIVLLGMWRPVVSAWENSWYLFVPLSGQGSAVLAAVLGVVEIVVGLLLAGPMVRTHARWVRAVLGDDERRLRRRVEHLAQSRTDVVDHEANELRRIERDLHDGAQARLVAMGMTLSAAERVLDENPDAARAMLQEARQTSVAALTELRELVRGIHPPVLADRGLVDAIRARALESPLHVEVRSTIAGRPLPPLESAVYFAVSELLANVGKHAEASSVEIDVTQDDGMLRVNVRDDGRGGADAARGTGLRGIERRLAAFDGFLVVHSPEGGPTDIGITVPCRLGAEG
ncbi:sensor histidine kinase [Cellulomonas sp. B6]|uniref:sensor histidine kinase n=1 Tax=Cellulomonas sp. B6 TaxID=1295626 RepID=UPI000A603E03|nr:sensor histidine kinase [Cellulomonas sp. B6]